MGEFLTAIIAAMWISLSIHECFRAIHDAPLFCKDSKGTVIFFIYTIIGNILLSLPVFIVAIFINILQRKPLLSELDI